MNTFLFVSSAIIAGVVASAFLSAGIELLVGKDTLASAVLHALTLTIVLFIVVFP